MARNSIIVIDLDGTLIHTDMLMESVCLAIRTNIFYIFLIPMWLIIKGRAYLKYRLSIIYKFDPKNLPYNIQLINWIERKKKEGFYIVLCTATYESIAMKISTHLKLFDYVIASNQKKNLSGKKKAQALLLHFSEKSFSYAGNSWSDIHIWNVSNNAILIKPSFLLALYARKNFKIEKIFS